MLSIIIPAYNESLRITKTLEDIRRFLVDRKYEIIVVDDGSTDNTVGMVQNFGGVRCISYRENRGKGFAIREGIKASSGDYLLIMDADNSTNIREFEKLEKYLSKFPIVIGSRYLSDGRVIRKQSYTRICISRIGNLSIRWFLVPEILDTQCGFKLIEATLAKKIVSLQVIDRFGFDIELLHISWLLGKRIKEVGIEWTDMPGSHFSPLRDIGRTLLELLRIRINSWRGRYGSRIIKNI